MERQIRALRAGLLLLAALGCATPKVWVPPHVDLHACGTLGLIEFQSVLGYGPSATQRFLAALHAAQAGVPVLELGPLATVLESVGHQTLGPDAVRAIGERYGVDVVVAGELAIDPPRPNFSIESFTEANASAEILGTLQVRFLDTRSAATTWSDRASGRRTVARLNLAAGRTPDLDAVDPQREHAPLLAWLVGRVTGDFRGRWARP